MCKTLVVCEQKIEFFVSSSIDAAATEQSERGKEGEREGKSWSDLSNCIGNSTPATFILVVQIERSILSTRVFSIAPRGWQRRSSRNTLSAS